MVCVMRVRVSTCPTTPSAVTKYHFLARAHTTGHLPIFLLREADARLCQMMSKKGDEQDLWGKSRVHVSICVWVWVCVCLCACIILEGMNFGVRQEEQGHFGVGHLFLKETVSKQLEVDKSCSQDTKI